MAEEEISEMREKLDKQEEEFENYREECKVLENFLEEESQKKEQEIRKLKEDGIGKEKTFKLARTENSQLQTEVASLKGELAIIKTQITTKAQSEEDSAIEKVNSLQEAVAQRISQSQKLSTKLTETTKQIESYSTQVSQLKQTLQQKDKLIEKMEELRKDQIEKTEEERKEFNRVIGDQKAEVKRLTVEKREANGKANKNNDKEKDKYKDKNKQVQSSPIKTAKKEDNYRYRQMEAQLLKAEERLKRYDMKLMKMEMIIKELKQRLADSKVNVFSEKGKEDKERAAVMSKVYTGCIIQTKPYYISPFLEVIDEAKTIKLYKSSRQGCFQKSLGASRHRLDAISHEHQVIIDDVVSRIKNFEEDYPHFILIFGSKKTSKRNILATIIADMFYFLKDKIDDCPQSFASATYIRQTAEYEHPDEYQEALTSEDVLELLQKVMSVKTSLTSPTSPTSPKKSDKGLVARRVDKARLTYFSFKIKDFSFEIATSSFTGIPVREKDSLSTFYSKVLFSKLPDILQTSYGQKYLILTLNPIVELYEDCKNILSATLYRSQLTKSKEEEAKDMDVSKEMLSSMARRKLEQFEKIMESSTIKIRKVEDECFFYKMKFEELEERLKNLISTHHNQSSYLKKSPILLSYEKMLKFIHSVQNKFSYGPQMSLNVINLNDLDFEGDLSLEAL